MFEDDLKGFIENQLSNMARNVSKNSDKNIEKRGNNPFVLFEGVEEKYMAVGRSLDSQLGTRLQKIAFYIARYRFGFEKVPNVILFSDNEDKLTMTLVSYPIEWGMTQKVCWGNDLMATMSKTLQKKCENSTDDFFVSETSFTGINVDEMKRVFLSAFEEENRNEIEGKSIPYDLLFIDTNGGFHVYEIKAGGNLDTKNKIGNGNEVLRLEQLFSFISNCNSKFATCYNNRGEGNAPEGSIFSILDDQHKVIGKEFWEEILPEDLTYERFIQLYATSFRDARVREIIATGQ